MGVPFSKIIQNNNEYDIVDKVTQGMIAQPFSANKSGGYNAGDVIIYDNKLYKFTSAHSGAWTELDVEQVDVVGETASTVSGALDWKYVNQSTGLDTPIAIPSGAKELFIVEKSMGADRRTVYIPTILLGETTQKFIVGYYSDASHSASITINATISEVSLHSLYLNGINQSSGKIALYYR